MYRFAAAATAALACTPAPSFAQSSAAAEPSGLDQAINTLGVRWPRDCRASSSIRSRSAARKYR